MNVFTGVGRLGKDAEIRHTQGGAAVCSFNLAIDYGFGDRKGTIWMACSLWGKAAESKLPEYLLKGKQVAVTGEVGLNEWTTKEGEKRTTVTLNVSKVTLVGGKSDSSSSSSSGGSASNDGGAVSFDDDDIPF